ncbi:MAG TPA: succinate dehydrogenase, hydrophobic membrane anchor protein [Burkholderiaceae bacterium]|nr:succinate dehydrogenase, hydrophobic membrane anchor protein [Burkholderiaceae bacterium]
MAAAKDMVGSRRLVVGAHYGIGAWVGQRITALFMGVYFVGLLACLLWRGDFTYLGWAQLFAPIWAKALTVLAWGALLYHVWVGVRDIWMDYVRPVSLRLLLHVLSAVWLAACGVWAMAILWRV